MGNVYLASNDAGSYSAARRTLAESIMKLQALGFKIETDDVGRLKRHRRFSSLVLPGVDPGSPDNLALAANGGKVIAAPGAGGRSLINGTLVPAREYHWSTPRGAVAIEIALSRPERVDQLRIWQETRWWGERLTLSTAEGDADYIEAGAWTLAPRKGGHQALEVFRFPARAASRVRLEFKGLPERNWNRHSASPFDEERPWPFSLLEIGVYRTQP